MRTLSIPIACVVLSSAPGCAASDPGVEPIVAAVTDGDGAPVSGARVSFHGAPAVLTDADGRASSDAVPGFIPCVLGETDGALCDVAFGVIVNATTYRLYSVTEVQPGDTVRYVIDEPEDEPTPAGELTLAMPAAIAGQASALVSVCGAVIDLAIDDAQVTAPVIDGCDNADGEYVAMALAVDGFGDILGSSIVSGAAGASLTFAAFVPATPREFRAVDAGEFDALEMVLPEVTARGSRLPLLDPLDIRGAEIFGGGAQVQLGFPGEGVEQTRVAAALRVSRADGVEASSGRVVVSAAPGPVVLDADALLPGVEFGEVTGTAFESELLSDASAVTGVLRRFVWSQEVDGETIEFEWTSHARPRTAGGFTTVPVAGSGLSSLSLPGEVVSWDPLAVGGEEEEPMVFYRLPSSMSFADARDLLSGRFDQAVARLDAPIAIDFATFIQFPVQGP